MKYLLLYILSFAGCSLGMVARCVYVHTNNQALPPAHNIWTFGLEERRQSFAIKEGQINDG